MCNEWISASKTEQKGGADVVFDEYVPELSGCSYNDRRQVGSINTFARGSIINRSVRPLNPQTAPPSRPITKHKIAPEQRITIEEAVDVPQHELDASEAVPVEPQQIMIAPEPIAVQPLRVVRKVRPMPMSLSKEEISNYIQTLRSGQTIEDKEHAATVLGSRAVWRYADDPIINDVYNALASAFRENTDEELLRSTASALGSLGREDAGTILVNYLSYGNSNNVKCAVVGSLGRLGYTGSVNHLVRLLLYDNDTELRVRSAEALGMIGDSSAGYALLSALNNTDRRIKRASIDALGNLNLPEAEYPILNILNNESDLELREAAARALQKIRNK